MVARGRGHRQLIHEISSSAAWLPMRPSLHPAGQRGNHRSALNLQSALVDTHEAGRLPPDWLELRDLVWPWPRSSTSRGPPAGLHLAQQALSASVRRLEADLGVQGPRRSTRHVALTAAGEALVEPARHVLASAADAGRGGDPCRQGRRRQADHRLLDGGGVGADGARAHPTLRAVGPGRRHPAGGARLLRPHRRPVLGGLARLPSSSTLCRTSDSRASPFWRNPDSSASRVGSPAVRSTRAGERRAR